MVTTSADDTLAPSQRGWRTGLALGLAVTVLGWSEVTDGWSRFGLWSTGDMVTVLLAAIAVVFYRSSPGVALGGVWLASVIQLVTYSSTLTLAHGLVLMIVCYSAARYGSRPVLWAAFFSIPIALITAYVGIFVVHSLALPGHLQTLLEYLWNPPRNLSSMMTVAGIAFAMILLTPWLVGWALRARDRQMVAEKERDLAESWARASAENARLREDQARLARDVHDVVGHSLAVILAQAEASKYVDDADLTSIRETLDNVTDAARRSLQDVRQVLAGTADASTSSQISADASSLLDSLRSGGFELDVHESGNEQPLPPDLEVVVYRVVQEMVTNALKHAAKGSIVVFSRQWGRELTLSMANLTPIDTSGQEPDGMGLMWMRRRVEAVGGRIAVTRAPSVGDADLDEHTVTVRLPLSGMEING